MKNKIIIILLIIFLIPLQINAIVPKSDKEYVTDQANVLTEESEEYIIKYSSFLYKVKQIDYYVVTVDNLEGIDIEDYTNDVYKEYKINKEGLLILYSKEDGQIRIVAGETLSTKIDNKTLSNYIKKYFMPYLERYEYNDGIMNGYNALYKYICDQYEIDASSMYIVEKLDFLTKYSHIIMIIMIWVGFLIGGRFVKYYLMYRNKMIRDIAETIELGSIIIFNIFLLSLAYLLKPTYILLVLASEFIAFFSSISRYKSLKERKVKRIKKHQVKKERKLKLKYRKK